MNFIQVTCMNPNCDRVFRVPEYSKPNSTIKNNPGKQECLICKNTKLLDKAASSNKKSHKSTKVKSKNSKKNNINKALDNSWAKLVKLKGGYKCAVCGNKKHLNSHHIYSRLNHSVRWATINGICLCVGCHIGPKFSAHRHPVDFVLWLMEKMGKEWVMKLKIKANSTAHYHDFEKQIMLTELNKEINKYEST